MIIKNFLYGLIIGLGFIIPGVSGGVLATILGIYNIILDKLNNLFKNFKNNIYYLLPIIIGIILSIMLFSNIILYLLDNNLYFISYVFIGLILGCVPYLLKEIKSKSNKYIKIIPFILSFSLGIILYLIETNYISNTTNPGIITMILAGVLYSIGKLVPGISGASLLMLIGVYEYFLGILANPLELSINTLISFIPFIISFLISSIFIIRLLNFLIKKHYTILYSAIIGFILSSTLFIYSNYISILSVIIMILSFIISYTLSN